ncbi:MAG: peptidoglycan-binding domain-containing protein [Patescibacteria group bacterium]|mgnify:FL=1
MSYTFQRSFHRFLLLSGAILGALLLTTQMAFAGTVTMQDDITYRINDTGGTARNVTIRAGSTFQMLTINDSNFAFNLLSGEEINLDQGDAYIFEADITTTTVVLACQGDTNATARITKVGTTTISLRSTKCASTGGGGGTQSTTPPPAPPAPAPAPSTTPSPAPAPSTTPAPSPAPSTTPSPAPSTKPSPAPSAAPATTLPPPVSSVFKRGLAIGMSNADVKRLQTLLATDSAIYPEGIMSGYFGPLTKAAVARFQMKHGLVSSASDAGYGYVGPKTRKKLQEVYSGDSMTPSPPPSSGATTDNAAINSLKSQIEALQKMLDALKARQ